MDTLIDTVALKRRHAITAATDVGQNAPPDFGEGVRPAKAGMFSGGREGPGSRVQDFHISRA